MLTVEKFTRDKAETYMRDTMEYHRKQTRIVSDEWDKGYNAGCARTLRDLLYLFGWRK